MPRTSRRFFITRKRAACREHRWRVRQPSKAPFSGKKPAGEVNGVRRKLMGAVHARVKCAHRADLFSPVRSSLPFTDARPGRRARPFYFTSYNGNRQARFFPRTFARRSIFAASRVSKFIGLFSPSHRNAPKKNGMGRLSSRRRARFVHVSICSPIRAI